MYNKNLKNPIPTNHAVTLCGSIKIRIQLCTVLWSPLEMAPLPVLPDLWAFLSCPPGFEAISKQPQAVPKPGPLSQISLRGLAVETVLDAGVQEEALQVTRR